MFVEIRVGGLISRDVAELTGVGRCHGHGIQERVGECQ